ncbi:MAG: LemA family protein [Myxococcota bacterium]
MEPIELKPKESKRLINLVIRDHRQAEAKRDRLMACNDLNTLRLILIEAGIPRHDVDATLGRFRRKIERRRRARKRVPYVIGALVLLLTAIGYYGVGWVVPRYDQLVAQREDVRRDWAQIDTLLQRRYDLIPNLVEATRGLANHEATVLTDIADAHAGYVSARTPGAKIEASYAAERGIRACLLLGARYPELEADRAFMRLMDELTQAEDLLAQRRLTYNETVREFNTGLQTVDGRIVGALTGLELAEYYEPPSTTEAAPFVKFVEPPPAPVAVAPEPVDAAAPAVAPVEVVDPLERLVVSAIHRSKRGRKATLTFPNGATRRVKMGDTVPGFDARVVGINPRSVLVEGPHVDDDGRTVRRTVRLTLEPR